MSGLNITKIAAELNIDEKKAIAQLNTTLTKLKNIARNNPIKVDLKVPTKPVVNAIKQIKNLQNVASKNIEVKIDIDGVSENVKSGLDQTEKDTKKRSKKITDYYSKMIAARRDLNKAISNVTKDQSGNKAYLNNDEINNKLKEMRTLRDKLSSEIRNYEEQSRKNSNFSYNKKDAAALNALFSDSKRMRTELQDISEMSRRMQIVPEVDNDKLRTFDKLGNRLTAYHKQFGAQIEKNTELANKYNTLMYKLNNNQFSSTRDANNAFADFRMQCRKAGIEVESFGSLLQRTFGSRVRSALAGQGVYMIQTALREIAQSSLEVDTAMTELKKVTDLTASGYNDFLEGAQERAAKLGATLTEVVNATADYARLGYSVPQATLLADSALIYQNVGDDVENIDDATSALISTMQGFGIAAENSMSIVDKFNNVSNNYASSAGDIGEMVKRSAAAMSAAGNTLDQTIALGVAANEVQQDADTVGTALKTMSMRLRGSKSELEAAGLDVEGMASSTSKLREEMMALTGVDIMLDENTFKSSYDILMGIGEVWDQLTDVSQANKQLFHHTVMYDCKSA